MPTTRTPSRPGMVAVGGHTPPKDVEAAIDGYMRSESCGVSFDSAALTLGVTGESLRLQLEPGDRHVLPASRVIPLLRRLGTVEPFNAYLRLDGCKIGGLTHQLVPVVVRPCSGDVLADTAEGTREIAVALQAVIARMDGGIDPVEARELAPLYRALTERLAGLTAHVEALARREAP